MGVIQYKKLSSFNFIINFFCMTSRNIEHIMTRTWLFLSSSVHLEKHATMCDKVWHILYQPFMFTVGFEHMSTGTRKKSQRFILFILFLFLNRKKKKISNMQFYICGKMIEFRNESVTPEMVIRMFDGYLLSG